jgi:acyl-homoserine-lactone acylase
MRHPRSLVIALAIAAAGAGLAACSSSPPSASGSTADTVTIVRDSAGVPHITAGNFHALGYGEATAFAQDNFCTLAQDFVTVNGDRSRYFGPDALSLNYSAGVSTTNLDSDFYWKSVVDSGLLQREIRQKPPLGPLPQVLSLYDGFVAGYNAYLASGALRDPTCAGKPWIRPITLTDMFLRGFQIMTEASSQQFVSAEVRAAPPSTSPPSAGTATATTAALRTTSPDLPALAADFESSGLTTLGSNGIGIGSQDTAAGDGMVLANPHFPWQGTERFWMAQLTVPGQYDVEGGTLMGFPLIGIGFNQNLAWTHTVSTSFRFTAYQLKLAPGDPTSYLVDGKAYPMGTLTVAVDTGHGTAHHTFYTTRWGTVVDSDRAGYHWTSTAAYALDDAMHDDAFRAANQYLKMGQATSVSNLLAVESTYLAIPTFNTIAADDTGHAFYGDVGNTPNVPASLIASCMPSGLPQLVFKAAGVVTLDGSRSACAWRTDPGTPVPGIFDAAHEPHTIRTDYVENSNGSYWLANPSSPFPAYSPIIGNIDVQQGLRTQLGNQMIAARIAGTDGFGPPKFTLASLQRMWESDQSRLAQLVLGSLVGLCRSTPTANAADGTTVDLAPACSALAGYDKTGNLDASGGWLFSEWFAYAPSYTSSGFWSDAFDPAHPLTTPSHLNTANPAMLTALADAVESLDQHHIPLDATYGQVQHVDRNGTTIPIPGCDTGCFNAIYAANGKGGPLSAFPYGTVDDGSSLVMTTELTSHGPVSQGILTYSQATDPTSPWYDNMTKLYSQKRWVDLAFTPAQLAAEHGNQSTVLTAS